MYSLKKQKGFTIVELLIVIVVIGILATLVIVTFSGVQKKARDSQRKTDIGALESHLQNYYADNDGKYPTLANLQDSTWVNANLKGLDPEALKDPKGGTIAGTATASAYGYTVTPANCDNGANGDCTNFTVTAKLESGGPDFTKASNN